MPDSRFILALIASPIITSLGLLALTVVFLALQPTLVLLLPAGKEGLDEAVLVLPVAQLIAGLSPVFGGLQYLFFGGVALWVYLQNNPARPLACALLMLAVNGLVTAGIYLLGHPEFGEFCLRLGSFFAPLWGLVFALLYDRSLKRAAKTKAKKA
ncbi:hypothetical protein DL239_16865 [Sedimentitalea sp. CY04]|uniref:DUF4386 domain-containing protein n=1 Tax=Parasedimentitalea denitrificans TaxID=2211118 RepID=A0ABX0WD45_9RHOB|nr:hypothetical protein [Sedimentitalea sp. CY04]